MGTAKVEMPVVLVETCGTFCPVPILELAKAVRKSAPGAVLELRATDPAVEADVRAWCEATGHRLLAQTREGPQFRAQVRLKSE